jgi:acyl-CoA synthetase (AMP-forming)/AMP-acid ligase II
MNCSLFLGCTVVTMPRFELEGFLEIFEKHEITFAHLVPPIVLALAKHPLVEKHDLSALRVIVSGAAPLSADLSEACAARLGCSVIQGYGLTETSPVTHVSSSDPAQDVAGSVGPCISNTECKIVDAQTGESLGPGERGEIAIRGPQVMKGYLNDPEATSAMIDEAGWLHTGDIGYADEQGRFFIVDRVKELIKYKGMQVAPAELEGLLLKHPAVADAAVVGSPDEEAGEVPKAFLVRRGEVDASGIMAFVADHVAPHKKIRRVEFVEQIPKSPSGKILRRLLIEQERAAG